MKETMLHNTKIFLTLSVLFAVSTKSYAQAEQPSFKTFENFQEFRFDFLSQIATAKNRIWLSTDFISDGEIVSALYIAQYRKIDVQVLLGKNRVHGYMSRLNYLKKQKIPVYLYDKELGRSFLPTNLIVDDKFYSVDQSLDFMLKNRKINTYDYTNNLAKFEATFANTLNKKIPVASRPVPLVGRPRNHNNWKAGNSGYQPKSAYSPAFQNNGYQKRKKEDNIDTYYYDRSHPKPSGVPDELPKKTKQQLKNNVFTK